MRDIKFRVWDSLCKDMIFLCECDHYCKVFYAFADFIGFNKTPRPQGINGDEPKPGRFAFMQFTGLKDKNSKELDWWEGDIFDDAGILKVIIKDKGCFWFENIKSKRRIPCYQVVESSDEWADDIKKQGNIYTHPELLEDKQCQT